MAHLCTIPSQAHVSAVVRITALNCRNGPSQFVIVRVGRVCKQWVGGSSSLVSTLLIWAFIRWQDTFAGRAQGRCTKISTNRPDL